MRRTNLKLAIVATGLTNQQVATRANALLLAERNLTELDISKIITERKTPTRGQISALCSVLGHSAMELFPESAEGRGALS
jgi:hypothetical protein